MTSKDEKKNITRQNLQLHGIHYDAEVYNGNDGPTSSIRAFTLPDHVDAVREILLTFSGIIPPEEWVAHLQEEFVQYGSQDIGPSSNLQPPDSAIVRLKTYETRDTSMVYKDAFAKLKMHEEAAEEARTLLTNLEPGWQTFWREQVFKTASKDARMQPGFRYVMFQQHHMVFTWCVLTQERAYTNYGEVLRWIPGHCKSISAMSICP